MMERPDYDALAQDINLEDITSCERNANILRILRDGDPNWNKRLYIMNEEDEEADPDEDFLVREGDDLGWLGYFIGKSEVIKFLNTNYYFPEGGDNYFFDGMSQNRSITYLAMHARISVDSWISLGRFLGNTHNLSHLEFQGIMIGHEDAQNLATALGRIHHNSLKRLSMDQCEIGDEGLAEIATPLRSHPQLTVLQLFGNNIGRDGCVALGNTLSSWPHSNKLQILNITGNAIDDGGLHALVSGMMNCRSLKNLSLGGNRSITGTGFRSLSPLLQSEAHSLEYLSLYDINFGNDGAMALAEGLKGNKFLKGLSFDVETAGITTIGWSAFSTLLCDTSTINSTYLSNHTLTRIGCYNNEGTPQRIRIRLSINNYSDRDAAICKILRSHPDLDMEPFFKLNMQFLPAVMCWIDRVERKSMESTRGSQSRKLSALYKFVRAMPDLTSIGYWEGRMIHIEAKRRRIADERRRLDDEERRLECEEKVTLERLGDRPMDGDEVNRNKRMRHE
jgi:hypothetical protein